MQHWDGTPSTRMVHAPQEPSSQPSFVPVRDISSRRTSSKSRFGGAATSWLWPLTLNRIKILFCFIKKSSNKPLFQLYRTVPVPSTKYIFCIVFRGVNIDQNSGIIHFNFKDVIFMVCNKISCCFIRRKLQKIIQERSSNHDG